MTDLGLTLISHDFVLSLLDTKGAATVNWSRLHDD